MLCICVQNEECLKECKEKTCKNTKPNLKSGKPSVAETG